MDLKLVERLPLKHKEKMEHWQYILETLKSQITHMQIKDMYFLVKIGNLNKRDRLSHCGFQVKIMP